MLNYKIYIAHENNNKFDHLHLEIKIHLKYITYENLYISLSFCFTQFRNMVSEVNKKIGHNFESFKAKHLV